MNETKPTNGATARTHFTLLGRDLRPGDKVTNAELSRLPPGRFDVLVRNHYLSTIEVVEDERQAKTGKAVTVAQKALDRAQAVVVEIDKRIAEVRARAETNDDQRGDGVLKLTRARGPKAKSKREVELAELRGEHSAIDTELQDTFVAKSRAEDEVKRAEHKLSIVFATHVEEVIFILIPMPAGFVEIGLGEMRNPNKFIAIFFLQIMKGSVTKPAPPPLRRKSRG